MLGFLKKLYITMKGAKEIYRFGGIRKAIIAYPSYGEILKGKSILITGGSSGIGYAIANKCINSGAKVVITGRDENKLKTAVCKIDSKNCNYYVWDISDISDISNRLKDITVLLNGDIDVLVNNAGIQPNKFFGDVDEQEWNKIYGINLKGNYFLTQEIVKLWKDKPFSGYKKIINISSQGGFVGATYPYRMTKWDIRGLTEGLGKLLIDDNIIVNGIAPGIVRTGMQNFSLQQGDNIYTYQNPVKRVCFPEEIAELALFLIGDCSNFIIGQTIVCDGGYSLKQI